MTKIDTPALLDEIHRLLGEADTIILHRHIVPDGDALGAQFGLARSLKATWPEKTILCVGGDSPEDPWFPKASSPDDKLWERALAVVVDTSTRARVDDKRWSRAPVVVKIDHHPAQESFGKPEWVDTSYPSCSEMVADLIGRTGLKLPSDAASALYYGILFDTGRFQYPGVGEATFGRAARLAAAGADITQVTRALMRQSVEERRFEGWVRENFSVSDAGIAWVVVKQSEKERFGITTKTAADAVSAMENLADIDTWALFADAGSTSGGSRLYRVELRSTRFPMNGIATRFGGGGHRAAAGCMVEEARIMEVLGVLDQRAAEN